MPSFVEVIRTKLGEACFEDAELVMAAPLSKAFEDTAAIFRIGPLLLRFTRDRGQEFVDLAAQSAPERFYQFNDVDIAMGWRSVDQVLAMREPESVSAVLQRLNANFALLCDAFSGDREQFTTARVERAARERGKAFVARLQRKR
jgi:hypothetical protein